MPQFDAMSFAVQFLYATGFFFFFYLIYLQFFLKDLFYSIRFRQKLLLFGSKLKVRIKSTAVFTEICKPYIN